MGTAGFFLRLMTRTDTARMLKPTMSKPSFDKGSELGPSVVKVVVDLSVTVVLSHAVATSLSVVVAVAVAVSVRV